MLIVGELSVDKVPTTFKRFGVLTTVGAHLWCLPIVLSRNLGDLAVEAKTRAYEGS